MSATLDLVISTFQALAVAILAILPGASYTFAYERVFGAFGLSFADRVVRFLAASALFGALFSGPGLILYRNVVVTGDLGNGNVNAWSFELVVLGYVLAPTLLGSLIGYGHKAGWPWVRGVLGDSSEPRAWDYVWRRGTNALVRAKLKSGTWVAGLFATTIDGRRSYAAGYPEAGDIFLSQRVEIDPDLGEFDLSDDGHPKISEGGGLLLKWDELEYLEVQHYEGDE